jgi:hypothetical protein
VLLLVLMVLELLLLLLLLVLLLPMAACMPKKALKCQALHCRE